MRGTSRFKQSRIGCPVSIDSNRARLSRSASIASANLSNKSPRSIAALSRQAGNAALAAATALSISASLASATLANIELS